MVAAEDVAAVSEWLRIVYADRLRPPVGGLQYPYVDPGAAYTDVLWEWDAYFSCVGFSALGAEDPAIGRHAKGCIDNFIAYQGADGSIPYAIMGGQGRQPDPDRRRGPDSERNSCKPLLAQFALLTSDHLACADDRWLAAIRPALEAHVDHWYASQGTDCGLLTWRSHRGSGADNHPAYFQRPHDTVADPFLNSLMVRECRALATINERTGGDPTAWVSKAEELAEAVNAHLWDPIDEAYYCVDLGRGDPGVVRTARNWVVPLKFRAWTMAMPLFAKIAPPDRAERIVRKYLTQPDQLRSAHGLYSLAPCEPAYQIFANFNPSDWLGPVWVVSTYLGFRGLLNYGYADEAAALARDHLACLAKDFRANGCLHEYYEPETGAGLTHPGFVNWNSCAALMAPELDQGPDHTDWD